MEFDFTDISNPSCSNTVICEFRVSQILKKVAEFTTKNQYPTGSVGNVLNEMQSEN